MKNEIKQIINNALEKARQAGELELATFPEIVVEKPKDEKMGDFSTNVAMTMARSERKSPKVIAESVTRYLENGDLSQVEVAGPGFINIKMSPEFFLERLRNAVSLGKDFGRSDAGQGTKVLIEFVSANPTGPLHVGHGRGAAVGDSLARILKKAGYNLSTEYYVNDVGNQMNFLGRSTWLRYRELLGETIEFPEDHYRGDYIKEIAREVFEKKVMLAGCKKAGSYDLFFKQNGGDKKKAEKECFKVRTDGRSVDIDGDYTETLARLASNPNGIGVFGLSFLLNNTDTIYAAKINGIEASTETIASGVYPVSRPLYFYVKMQHLGVIPGLQEYVDFFVSDEIAGPDGPLSEYGLVSDPELAATQAMVANGGTKMGPLN